jgi:hypothetical protein
MANSWQSKDCGHPTMPELPTGTLEQAIDYALE